MLFHLRRLFRYFLLGVLSILPFVVVVQVVLFIKRLLIDIEGMVFGYTENLPLAIGVLIFSIFTITSIGYSITQRGTSLIVRLFEVVIDRIPVLSSVYRISKKLIAMVHDHREKPQRREVMYVEYPKDGMWAPGWVTNRHGEMVVLYVPSSPNPTSGFTIIVHQSRCIPSNMNIEEVSSFIVSLGSDYHKLSEVGCLPKADQSGP